jgi:hypothetical protein
VDLLHPGRRPRPRRAPSGRSGRRRSARRRVARQRLTMSSCPRGTAETGAPQGRRPFADRPVLPSDRAVTRPGPFFRAPGRRSGGAPGAGRGAAPRGVPAAPRRIVVRRMPVTLTSWATPPCPRWLASRPTNGRRRRSSSGARTRSDGPMLLALAPGRGGGTRAPVRLSGRPWRENRGAAAFVGAGLSARWAGLQQPRFLLLAAGLPVPPRSRPPSFLPDGYSRLPRAGSCRWPTMAPVSA